MTSVVQAPEADRRPVLAVIVNNDIRGDSRVIKTAVAASRAGWEVVLLGRATSKRVEVTQMGSIEVVRVPLKRTGHARFEAMAKGRPEGAAPTRVSQLLKKVQRRVKGRRVATRITRRVIRMAAARSLRRHGAWLTPVDPVPRVGPEDVLWRRDWPILTDWWRSFGPALADLKPDLIHANDVMMLMVAARTAADLRTAGHDIAWIYDAHEYVSAVDWGNPTVSAAYRQIEAEYIGRADAVVTVSDDIAKLLEEQYGLKQRPHTVANAPIEAVPLSSYSIRQESGIATDVPLMVYSGYVAPERGLDVVIDALPLLDGVHLAVVANAINATLEALLDRATELGVRDRIHIAPYVPPFAVPGYLSSADLGLTPHHPDPNHENSLPTKFAEYLHAGLPIVASSMKTTSAFIDRTGVGVVFEASNPQDLAKAVQKVLRDRETIKAAISQDLRRELSWEYQVDRLLSVYEKVTGLRPIPPKDLDPWDVEEGPANDQPSETSVH